MVIERNVGEKEVRFRSIAEELKELRVNRDAIDELNKELLSDICDLEMKSPDLSMDEFKKLCYLKFNLKENQDKRKCTCQKIAKLIKESTTINKAVIKSYQDFKTFAYMKKKIDLNLKKRGS